MDSKIALEQIEKMLDTYKKTCLDAILERDVNSRKCYKVMADSQRKCMEELIKIYHRQLDKEEEAPDGNDDFGSDGRDSDYFVGGTNNKFDRD